MLIKVIVVLTFFFAIQTVLYLSTQHFISPKLVYWLGLNSDFSFVLSKPWTVLSYAFLHKNVNHFIGNLVFLYFTGREFLNLFSSKQFMQTLLGGVFFGGSTFLLITNYTNYTGESILLGASAGVLALLVFITVYSPKYKMYLTEHFSVEIWIITLLTFLYILLTSNKNTGGNFAHLGGVLFALIYALYVKVGFEIKPKNNLKTVHRSVIKSANDFFSKEEQQQIDKILDKMNQSGYDSLTKKEKQYLFKRRE